MRNVIIGSIILIFFNACDSYNRSRLQKQKEEIQKAIIAEANSPERIDSIFLDYSFGMSEKEFYAHTRKLYKQKKLILEDNTYVFNTKIGDAGLSTKVKIRYSPEFFNDSLVSLTLGIEGDELHRAHKGLLSVEMAGMLLDAYRSKHKVHLTYESLQVNENETEFYLFKNNLLIEIKHGIMDDVRVFYTDKPNEDRMQMAKLKKEREVQSKRINDF